MDMNDPIAKLLILVDELGWTVAIPDSGDETIPGLIIGTPNYVDKVTDALENKYDGKPFWMDE